MSRIAEPKVPRLHQGCLWKLCTAPKHKQHSTDRGTTPRVFPKYIYRGQAKQAERNMASGFALDLLLIFFFAWVKANEDLIATYFPVILNRGIMDMLIYNDRHFSPPSGILNSQPEPQLHETYTQTCLNFSSRLLLRFCMVASSDTDIKTFFAGVNGKRESLKSP